MLELGSTGPLRPGLDPVAVERAVKSVGADGRAVSHRALAEAGTAIQGRATLVGPSIPFHTAIREQRERLELSSPLSKRESRQTNHSCLPDARHETSEQRVV